MLLKFHVFHFIFINTNIKEMSDNRKYIIVIKDKRKFVKCAETKKDEDGNILECTYISREDKHKTRKKPHVCEFKKKSHTNTISQYFNREELKTADTTPEAIYSKMSLLGGQKNLSLEFLTSAEFYDYTIFCMVAGKMMLSEHAEGDLFTQAKKTVKRRDRKFFRGNMIDTSQSVHQMTMQDFQKLTFCTIAIDEGKDSREKNLDFIVENPMSRMEPYPYFTIKIEDETTKGYLPLLDQGFQNAILFGINLGCVIADGNRAQKKCFSLQWKGSLRFTSPHQAIRSIIFVPCLCHKVNNGMVHAFKNNENVRVATTQLRNFGKECYKHQEEIKAKCPYHIKTRWVYDFLIANFIRTHQGRIRLFSEIPDSIQELFPNLLIMYTIVSKFESTDMMLCQAYTILMRALNAFHELEEQGNPFAHQFAESLELKTFNSEEGGVWYLAYLLTQKGQNENRMDVNGKKKQIDHPYLNYFHIPRFNSSDDPVEHLLDDDDENVTNDDDEPSFEEDEGELDDEDVHNDSSNEDEEDQVEQTRIESTHMPGEHEDVAVQAGGKMVESGLLWKAKDFLKKQLMNNGYTNTSADTAVKMFTIYIDEENPFSDCQNNSVIGFSWAQIKKQYSAMAPIADIALKLHSCPCSEASCERTISTQKLILSLRRQRSNRDLLDARLRLMRARLRE